MYFKDLFRKKTKNTLFTTPSHAQKLSIFHKFYQFYKYDISETDTHEPEKYLDLAQKRASEIYGTNQTLFLTNGSTSGIITAILATTGVRDNVLIWRNAHPCHKNGVELAGANTIYYDIPLDEDFGIPNQIEPSVIEDYLKKDNIKTVVITSPTYEGIVSDIKSIKDLCKKYNAYLIVDEAHGALYPFSDELPLSAVRYADITVQSLHKTAGGLNPTALIHSNLDFDITPFLKKINTTSPSYPLLATIEANINYLNSNRGKKNISKLIDNIKKLKQNCAHIRFGGDDITKILIKTNSMTGYELSEFLYQNHIEDEKTNEISVMLLCGIGTTDKKIKQLEKVLMKLK